MITYFWMRLILQQDGSDIHRLNLPQILHQQKIQIEIIINKLQDIAPHNVHM